MATLGIDLDGTMADSWSVLLQLMRKRYGIIATKNDLRKQAVTENEQFKHLARRQAYDAFVDVWKDYNSITLEHPRIPEILRWSRSRYENVYTVTSTVANNGVVEKYQDYMNTKTDAIYWFRNPKDKVSSGVDVIIDDSIEVAEAFANQGKYAILLAQPWNEDFRKANGNHANIFVAHDWTKVPGILLNINHAAKRSAHKHANTDMMMVKQ